MVRKKTKIKNQNIVYYMCEACKMEYSEKQDAERCEKWCKEHKSCNLDIIKKSFGKCYD